MCGIVGYVGPRQVIDVLMPGLARLEYRGYDSAGVALNHGGSMTVLKQAGRIADLQALVDHEHPAPAHTGIGHTRWATHGAPNTGNAHPHQDCRSDVVVAHNGIIENWVDLKQKLVDSGHEFVSDTDTEVVAHLLEEMTDRSLADAVRSVMNLAEGALALVVMRRSEPDLLVGARRGSPLVVGRGEGENFLASDIPAFLEHTRQMVVIDDDRIVEITSDQVTITDLEGNNLPLEERR
ncbi:MAG TPA: class II glutamine amidotransferase, partial [Acidimicrobiia bacterium]